MSVYRKIEKRISETVLIAKMAQRICPFLSPNYIKAVVRNMRICSGFRYTPAEAFRLGFFAPDFDTARLAKFISRKRLTKIQKKLNPEDRADLAKDKGLFYRFCLESSLRIPQLYLLCYDKTSWLDCLNNLPRVSSQQKIEFVTGKLPHQFVLKPIRSAYGKGVAVFTRNHTGFVDTNGSSFTPQELVKYLESDYPDAFLIQERIQNHPDIVALTGSGALQTVRFITLIDKKGQPRLLHAHFKPITKPDIIIDTHIEGLLGNVEVPVDIEQGILGPGNQIIDTGQGILKIIEHPLTGKPFRGFKLPGWKQACRLATSAAVKFLPLRTIGWDIALTPDGPCIIEANVWWDPPNQHLVMDKITEQMSDNI